VVRIYRFLASQKSASDSSYIVNTHRSSARIDLHHSPAVAGQETVVAIGEVRSINPISAKGTTNLERHCDRDRLSADGHSHVMQHLLIGRRFDFGMRVRRRSIPVRSSIAAPNFWNFRVNSGRC
jgi:hypothetical protein